MCLFLLAPGISFQISMIDNLREATFDLSNLADLKAWLSRHQPNFGFKKECHEGGFCAY